MSDFVACFSGFATLILVTIVGVTFVRIIGKRDNHDLMLVIVLLAIITTASVKIFSADYIKLPAWANTIPPSALAVIYPLIVFSERRNRIINRTEWAWIIIFQIVLILGATISILYYVKASQT